MVSIQLGAGSTFNLEGDFILGENIKIVVVKNGTLTILGKHTESGSGITANSLVMCNKSIVLGADLICSWNVFITDCYWHSIYENGIKKEDTLPVIIGNHNWIGSNVIIGPGSELGDNCIVSAFSKISKKRYPKDSTICGIKPIVLTNTLSWARDL